MNDVPFNAAGPSTDPESTPPVNDEQAPGETVTRPAGFPEGGDRLEPLEVRRLAEGRLSADERAALLEWAESHPGNWRAVAIALLEEQTLRSVLSTPSAAASKASAARPGGRLRSAALRSAAAAAACVTAAWCGAVYGRMDTPKPVVLVSSTPDMGARQRLSDLEAAMAWAAAPAVSESAARLFAEAGFEAEVRPELWLVSDDDGRQFALPRRRMSLRPVSLPVEDAPARDPSSGGFPAGGSSDDGPFEDGRPAAEDGP